MVKVPNTNTFSLQDVVNVVIPISNNLVQCFTDSIDGFFDIAYKGSKDRLSNFRNYGATLTIYPTGVGFTHDGGKCSNPTDYSGFTINVTTQTGNAWTATRNASWIYLNGGTDPITGNGNGSFLVEVTPGGPRSSSVSVTSTHATTATLTVQEDMC